MGEEVGSKNAHGRFLAEGESAASPSSLLARLVSRRDVIKTCSHHLIIRVAVSYDIGRTENPLEEGARSITQGGSRAAVGIGRRVMNRRAQVQSRQLIRG
eukprot:CAMPEP_0184723614 /NCGR_PEP_ID=MMETSP0314-20130426/25609_1 /TAXON_ID=38298 /ORGANISM="Rhodella maculata, Strain CCMP 736" /LENGTH=99 /DNA_ID=CAMNT_0027188449 /DNA_START=476 /DNA_END=776 /DNA_ORIENTATION=+